MTPADAFNDTLGRARLLLRLHDGLINQRQRRIRSDWKARFVALMRWPASQRIERVDTGEAIVVLRNGSQLTPEDFTRESMDELLRAAVATGVSALDRYVHERVTKGIVSALRQGNLNRQQRDFQLPAATAMRIADKVRAARNSKSQVRPANEIRTAVQEEIHKRPFQGWRDIEDAFALIGVTGISGKLQNSYRIGDVSLIKSQLNDIVRRRNEIVHEGDLQVHQRGGSVKRNEITHTFVKDSLDFIEHLVGHLDNL